jgi:hypothetical protein
MGDVAEWRSFAATIGWWYLSVTELPGGHDASIASASNDVELLNETLKDRGRKACSAA